MQASVAGNTAGQAQASSGEAGASAQGGPNSDAAVATAGAQATAASKTAGREDAAPVMQASAGAQAIGAPQTETPTQAREAEVASANAKLAAAGPSEARLAMERSNAQGAESEGGDTNEQVRGGGRFRRKCEAVANTFLLSRRETEILFFLAKGHNAAYIQEKLYISEGTAKTHIRHIYRKLDVHSQQELMRTVEDAAPAE